MGSDNDNGTRPDDRRSVRPTQQQRKAARMLARGANFMDALMAAGYSPAQARKGLARVVKSRGLVAALRSEIAKYPPEARANIVRLRLLQNVLNGEDVATKSARLLGLDREVKMWQDEQRQNVIFIQAPADWHPEPPRGAQDADASRMLPPSEAPFPDYE